MMGLSSFEAVRMRGESSMHLENRDCIYWVETPLTFVNDIKRTYLLE